MAVIGRWRTNGGLQHITPNRLSHQSFMDFLTLGILVLVFGPPAFFLAMSIRHFKPLLRGMKHPWWAPLLGPFIFLNDQYLSPDGIRHRKPWAYYTAAFVGWAFSLFLLVNL